MKMRPDLIGWVLLGLAVLALGTLSLFLPVRQWVLSFLSWVRGGGVVAAVLYILVYAVTVVFLFPSLIFTLAAGFIYGPFWGILVTSPAAVLGATMAFLVGRYLARERVTRWATRHPRFAAVDRAVGEAGLKIVLLLRLSPLVPYNLVNYAMGLTRVSLGAFVLGSFVGMLPIGFLYLYIGSMIPTFAGLAEPGSAAGGQPQRVMLWLGLAATLLVVAYVTRLARKALQEAVDAPVGGEAGAPGAGVGGGE